MSGPLLGLVAGALKLWLQSQCKRVDHLDLELLGSGPKLLQGHLEGARLEASGLRINALAIGHALVTSGAIRVDLARLRSGQSQGVLHAADLHVRLWFSPADLQATLLPAQGPGAGFALLAHFRNLHRRQCRNWSITTATGDVSTARIVLQPPAPASGEPPVAPLSLTLRVAPQAVLVDAAASPAPPTAIPLDPAFTLQGLESDAEGLVLRGNACIPQAGSQGITSNTK